MKSPNSNELLLRQRIAANMAYYRKLNGMTQSELAQRISYSDKSVSKWERAEGVPDIYVLTLLAGLFEVSVNDLISENAPLLPQSAVNINRNRIIILLLSIGLVWLIATVAYTALQIFMPSLNNTPYIFIAAIPVSCVIAVVFTSLWWGLLWRFVAVSALIWSLACGIYAVVPLKNMDLVFAIGAVLQVLAALWFLFQGQLRKRPGGFFGDRRKP